MNREIEDHGVEFIPANNDRAGGAQLIYTMLMSGELKISRNCVNTIESIKTRVRDEKEPVKVLKVVMIPR